MATNEANQNQIASDADIAIATAYGRVGQTRRRKAAEACVDFMDYIDLDIDDELSSQYMSGYNHAWRELTGLPNHWEDGPYTAGNMPEIPKVPTSCTGVGPYDDADALAQLNS